MQQKTISVTIPHSLGRDEARDRLRKGVTQVKTQYAAQIAKLEENWSDYRMDFRLTAMGQSLGGRVNIEAEAVRVDIDLPWLLAMLADKIKGQVEQRGRILLEDKRDGGRK
jgi:putative polyhydroxyalkanoate system protein